MASAQAGGERGVVADPARAYGVDVTFLLRNAQALRVHNLLFKLLVFCLQGLASGASRLQQDQPPAPVVKCAFGGKRELSANENILSYAVQKWTHG